MDPYEYLLNKLNVILRFMPESTRCYSLYIKLETDEKLLYNYIPIDWTTEQIFKFFRNIVSKTWLERHDKEIDCFFRQLLQFPNDLESIKHVDLLLTLNGMNKED